jgi:uncharacterized membrane protein
MKRALVLLLVLLVVAACAGDDDGGETTAAPPEQTCGEEVPLVDWDTFGHGFLTTYCQGCHASTTPDRRGAPEAVTFDTEEDALAWRAQILGAAASEAPTMPPNGGPSDDDRERLSIWLTCFAD